MATSPSPRLSSRRATPRQPDAIAFLKADHRQVAAWFDDYADAREPHEKLALARKICDALRVHATIEEEIFYPAFIAATHEKSIHHEAVIEHAEAKNLVAEIERSDPRDDYYDSRVNVLADMIKHHVREEEKPGGMFAEARKAGMDLQALGISLAARAHDLADPDERAGDE